MRRVVILLSLGMSPALLGAEERIDKIDELLKRLEILESRLSERLSALPEGRSKRRISAKDLDDLLWSGDNLLPARRLSLNFLSTFTKAERQIVSMENFPESTSSSAAQTFTPQIEFEPMLDTSLRFAVPLYHVSHGNAGAPRTYFGNVQFGAFRTHFYESSLESGFGARWKYAWTWGSFFRPGTSNKYEGAFVAMHNPWLHWHLYAPSTWSISPLLGFTARKGNFLWKTNFSYHYAFVQRNRGYIGRPQWTTFDDHTTDRNRNQFAWQMAWGWRIFEGAQVGLEWNSLLMETQSVDRFQIGPGPQKRFRHAFSPSMAVHSGPWQFTSLISLPMDTDSRNIQHIGVGLNSSYSF